MTKNTKIKHSWMLTVFGAVFAIPGYAILVFTVLMPLYDSFQMSSWPSVEGKLLSSEVLEHRSDSVSYQVIADYTYQVDGRVYEGERVSLHTGSDNVGDYHQDMHSMLQNSDNIVTVYYNPDDPQDALLDPSMRWGLVALLSSVSIIFALVGSVIAWLGWRGNKRAVLVKSSKHPWLTNKAWQTNQISSNAKASMYAIMLFCVFWNLISWLVFSLSVKSVYEESSIFNLLLISVFPLIGLFLIYLAVKAVKQNNYFGKTPLTMTPFPGKIGGQVGGKITLNENATSQSAYAVRVVCHEKYYSGSGKNRRLKENIVWEAHRNVYCTSGAKEMAIEFSVDVPEGLPETELAKEGSWHDWRVDVECVEIDFKRQFQIPVYSGKH